MIGSDVTYNNKHGVITGYAECGGTVYVLWVQFDGVEGESVFRKENIKKIERIK